MVKKNFSDHPDFGMDGQESFCHHPNTKTDTETHADH